MNGAENQAEAAAEEAAEAVEAVEAVDDAEGVEESSGADFTDVDDGDVDAEEVENGEDDDEAEDIDDDVDDEDADDEDDDADEDEDAGESDEEDNELTEEELDQIADTSIAALEDILKYFNLGEVTIDEYEGDEGELILDITGNDLAVLIGRHGKTLDALQFIISSITARTMGFRYPVVVDVEGYKGRQRQKLENLAFSSAKRALSQGRSIKMRPMTPYERRIVHIALREFDGVTTASEGEGSSRHVVVIPE
ncbi:MAG: KH domain-containing protein [Eggerthellaceae bacterium]|nr:KH domain-containing protein [Eggerthellaceae bacterium]